jgi:hypothetical protein
MEALKMLRVHWVKNTQDGWLPLDIVQLENVTDWGVYTIWHGGQSPRFVRVGQGDVKARVGLHKNDPVITAYSMYGRLAVTWAAVPAAQRDGVERYLAELLKPLVGDRFPQAVPIPVNHPWAA